MATLENENEVLKQQVKDLKKDLEKKTEEEKSDSDGRYVSFKIDVVYGQKKNLEYTSNLLFVILYKGVKQVHTLTHSLLIIWKSHQLTDYLFI